jgi:hypothetical protein
VQKTKSSHNTVLNEITMKVLIINVSNFDSWIRTGSRSVRRTA